MTNNDEMMEKCEELSLKKLNNIQNKKLAKTKSYFRTEIIWYNVISFVILHWYAFVTCLTFPFKEKILTVAFSIVYLVLSVLGITVFGHRYLTHRAFKANKPFEILMWCVYSMAGTYSPFYWMNDHSIHHKYCDTLADPYNAKRGFFYSHIGWLFLKKTPEYKVKKDTLDTSDFCNNKLLMCFERNYRVFFLIFTIALPTLVPCYFWNETFYHSVSFNFVRLIVGLHCIWSTNSFAHYFGAQPYDRKITPRENAMVTVLTMGEGWHNYHHTFPTDYKGSERGKYNLGTITIDFFYKIGWVYDLKEASPALVKQTLNKYAITSS